MGYTTEFEGSVTITPPLTAAMVAKFNGYAEERHDGDGPTRYATWCDWRVNGDGTEIAWNGGEKFYDSAAWMAWMIDRFIPANRSVDGQIEADGDDPGDRWLLKVTDRTVTVHAGTVAYADEGTTVAVAELGTNNRSVY
jgi:hypothetical protein